MPTSIESILKLEVPLIVQIARQTMSLEEVMSMTPGAIIELPKSADDDLEILVNNKEVGTGKAVKVGENIGVRVTSIGGLEQRITAMGGIRERISATSDLSGGPVTGVSNVATDSI